jgi:hypothetical protein
LLRDGIRPDLLLVEALPFCLGDEGTAYQAAQVPANRIDWWDVRLLERYWGAAGPNLRCDVALANVNPLYDRRSALLSLFAPSLLPALPPGAVADTPGPCLLPDDAPDERRARERERATLYAVSNLPRVRAGGLGGEALRELLASCRADGVPAAVVVMPEGPALRACYPAGAWPTIQGWLEQMCREEGAGLVVAEDWFAEDNFLDSHHLLRRGAEKFTDRLGREYLAPWLRGAAGGERSPPDCRCRQSEK